VRDAVNEGHLELFNYPAKLLTEHGEVDTSDRSSILWREKLGGRASDPREAR
jgi:hypothetical protein